MSSVGAVSTGGVLALPPLPPLPTVPEFPGHTVRPDGFDAFQKYETTKFSKQTSLYKYFPNNSTLNL